MHVTRAEPAARPGAPCAPGPAAGRARSLATRLMLLASGGFTALAALLFLAYALAIERVPQQRVALEELVHAQTGLNVRFNELGLRWGWYGPEAVFHGVELAEPGPDAVRLRAPQLVVGFDLWGMLRSGALEPGRISLIAPDIDLTRAARAAQRPGSAHAGGATPDSALRAGARILQHWRGTRIDIEGGTLRVGSADSTTGALAVSIRAVALRRARRQWTADAQVLLPERLGTAVHLVASMESDTDQPEGLSGSLQLSAERFELAGWSALLPPGAAAPWLPQAGNGSLALQLRFARGRIVEAGGTLEAQDLQWSANTAASAGLDHLRGTWRLTPAGGGWRLTMDRLELGVPGAPTATLTLQADADGRRVHGHLQRAPLAALAALARGLSPELQLPGVALGGLVREAQFDWDAGRGPEQRLRTTAQVEALSVGSRDGVARLEGVGARLTGEGRRLTATLHAEDARLVLARQSRTLLEGLQVHARLDFEDDGRAWRLETQDLEIRDAATRLALSGTLAGESSGAHPRIDARASLSGADVALVQALLGDSALRVPGAQGGQLTAGRVDDARLEVRGPLDEPLPWRTRRARFSASLDLHAAELSGEPDWPEVHDLEAHIDWRGARVHAHIASAAAGGFQLGPAAADWDARGARLLHLSGRLTGNAREALAWLRSHPRLQRYAPGVADIDLRGETVLAFDVHPGDERAAPGEPQPATRLTAVLDGVRLRPVAGVPAIESLRGTLAFADGRVLRSTLTGSWLGGPITLTVGERRERRAAALVIGARGFLNVRQALLASTGIAREANPVQGNAEWSAELRFLRPENGQAPLWRVRGDSNLIGVASRLPEPFAKPANSALALHVELAGGADAGELHLTLGERLRGLAALKRRGELWEIERGAVSFAAAAPVLPAAPVVQVRGSLSRLDLAGYALLWRQLTHNPAWPGLSARVVASELLAGGQLYPGVTVTADSTAGSNELRLDSARLAGEIRWPAEGEAGGAATLHLARLEVPPAGPADTLALIAALGSSTQVSIDELEWQGRPLGALSAALQLRSGALDISDLHLHGASAETGARIQCQESTCRASFSVSSTDVAATLAGLGLRPELSAAHGALSGEIRWSPEAPGPALATADGSLHIRLEEGVARSSAAQPEAPDARPLGLFAVPALIAGTGSPELHFSRLSADFAVHDGEAATSDLHFDGDAEILVRGRVGLLARDYDAQVWVLRGEERLPAAVRGLGPPPRMAALWLSLRGLFAGAGSGEPRPALHLRGTWDDPLVTGAD